ncbi:hypothetical protein [Rufibacter hautae]|uniref:Uncharacterized protein n=1 Tax=Rufibacter hautae TaxID=2595005 RepID=A0A5B6TAP1_9BACT|nr:hypothetical protein [Rufibacter hautae]KAA3436937.1 hypothetical protein FOA19_21415 [Rufibacter hautae]
MKTTSKQIKTLFKKRVLQEKALVLCAERQFWYILKIRRALSAAAAGTSLGKLRNNKIIPLLVRERISVFS